MNARSREDAYTSRLRVKQKRFPERSTRPKAKPSNQGLTRSARQTTLTQIDFCSPNTSFESIDALSDDEFPEDRPVKKRKSKDERQTTLTQIPWSSARQDNEDVVSVSSADEVVQETQEAAVSASEEPSSSLGPVDSGDDHEVSTSATKISQSRPSPELSSTPVRRVKLEIPSSNTPQSVLLSGRSEASRRSASRSPLEERSTNIPSSPQRFLVDHTRLNDVDAVEQSPMYDNGPVPLFRKPDLPARATNQTVQAPSGARLQSPRLLRKTSTIPDSQAESAEDLLEMLDHIESTYVPATLAPQSCAFQTQMSTRMTQATFDPVNSALDRDASRFMYLHPLPSSNQEPVLLKEEAAIEDGEDEVASDHNLGSPESESQSPSRTSMSRTIDLTDSSQPPASTASSVPTPARIPVAAMNSSDQPQAAHVATHQTGPSQASTYAGDDCTFPEASRVPQTRMPRIHSSPPRAQEVRSSPQPASSQKTSFTRRSSFSLHTEDVGYLPPLSPARADRWLAAFDSDGDLDFDPAVQTADDDDVDLLPHLPEHDHETAHGGGNERDRHSKRLKRAKELLPDSLLNFSLAAAPPPWTSSPPLPARSSPSQAEDKGKVKDYSLPPPSSDWRSSGRLRDRP